MDIQFIGLLCFILCLYTFQDVNGTAQQVVYNSKDNTHRQMMPQLLRIKKVRDKIEISVTMQQFGPRTSFEQVRSHWYVDGLPIGQDSRRYYTLMSTNTYTLGSHLPTSELRTKTFRLSIMYFQHEHGQCYKSSNYDINMNGADLPFPDFTQYSNNLYVFEHLDYFVQKTINERKYEARFNFSAYSSPPFKINDIVSTFEAGGIINTVQPYLFSTNHLNKTPSELIGDFIYMSDICHESVCQTSKKEEVSVFISPESTTEFHGMFKISVSTTNIFKIRISFNFDLTSYLYGCSALAHYPGFIPTNRLKITHFDYVTEGNDVALVCRVFGNELAQVSFFRMETNSKGPEIIDNKHYQPGIHETTAFLFLRSKDKRNGTYICESTVRGSNNIVTRSLNLNLG